MWSAPAGDAAWSALETLRSRSWQPRQREEKGHPWPQPLVSHYARYFRDGNRTAYEGLVAARQQRLTRAVVMALLAGRASRSVRARCDAGLAGPTEGRDRLAG